MVYVSRQDFLSGDVMTKLEVVDLLIKEDNSDFPWQHYQNLLEEVETATCDLGWYWLSVGSLDGFL